MRKLLLLTAALSLLSAPAAMAQHRHGGGGGGGHHAAAARHAGGGGARARANVRRGSYARRAAPARRAFTRSQYRGARSRAYARGTYNRRTYSRGAYNRRAYAHAGHYNRGVVAHRYGNRHWRHVARAGRWYRGGRLPYGYWRGRPWVNWRAHYLWAPPYGYEWVYVDGYYVLIAIGTGLIADIVLAY